MKIIQICSTGFTQGMSISQIILETGESTPKHYHKWTTEVYTVLQGTGILTQGDAQKIIDIHDSIVIEPGIHHQLMNTGESTLLVLSSKDRAMQFKDDFVS